MYFLLFFYFDLYFQNNMLFWVPDILNKSSSILPDKTKLRVEKDFQYILKESYYII